MARLLPYILLLGGCVGIYFMISGLQEDNAELSAKLAEANKANISLVAELKDAESQAKQQGDEIVRLKKGIELEQQASSRLAKAQSESYAALQKRLSDLKRNAKNDTKDDCSFRPMPDHITRMLFNGTDAAGANSDQANGRGETGTAETLHDQDADTRARGQGLD